MSSTSTRRGRRPAAAASISPRSSRSSGGDRRQADGGEDLLLPGPADPPPRLAVGEGLEDAVLVHGHPLADGQGPEGHVVGLGAGEVVEGGPEAVLGDDAEVDLEAPAQADGALRVPPGDGLPGPAEQGGDLLGPIAAGQDVQVPDGLPAAPERAGRRQAPNPVGGPEEAQDPLDDRLGTGQEEPPPPGLVGLDRLQELRLEGRAQPGQVPDLAGPGRRLEVIDGPGTQGLEEELHLLRPDPLDPQELEEGRRIGGQELPVLGTGPGGTDLQDLLGDPLADPPDLPDLGRIAAQAGERERQGLDGRRGVPQGPDAERVVAPDLRHIGHLGEDAGDRSVLHGMPPSPDLRVPPVSYGGLEPMGTGGPSGRYFREKTSS
jgi:hypothetical protein